MVEKNYVIVSDMVPVMFKTTDHKLNGLNYLDWSKTVRLYLWSIDKYTHLTDNPPKDDLRKTWLRDDACLFLHIQNSIDSEIFSLHDVFSRVLRTECTMSVQLSGALAYTSTSIITLADGSPSCVRGGDDDNLLVYSITSSEPVSAPTPVKLPIVQVYSRRKPPNSYPAHVPSSLDLVPGNDLPIALHKDDIVIIGSDTIGISSLKSFIHTQFYTKKLGMLKYFLGVEVTRSKKGDEELMEDPEKYRRLVGKLNYLTMTRPNIVYSVSVINADWAGSKVDRRSTSCYCVFIRETLVSWKSKKQNIVSRSSEESEYRAMAQSLCEIMWIYQLLSEIDLKTSVPAKLWCDNQAALHIASNPVFYERTKHIEIDCHFVREKIQQGLISTLYVKTGDQLGDIFTKALNGVQVTGITSEGKQQRQRQQRFQTQCNIQNLNALEPRQKVESEAGVTEFWDQNNEQLQCANVAVFRHRIQQRGLLVPAYTNTPEIFYVVQGKQASISSRGIHGVVFPGCAETFQDSQQQQSFQSSKSQDQHQKVRQLREGDIIALPTGAAHWIYNNGRDQLVLVALVDVGNSQNQLDQYFRKFYLGGNPQPQLQGFSQSQGGRSQGSQGSDDRRAGNLFRGFDERLLAEAFNVNPDLIRRLQRPQIQRGIIIRVEEELRVLSPQRDREQEQEECEETPSYERDNGFEETICTMKLRHNIDKPSHADVYNPRAGRVTTVNRFNLPILRDLQLSAEKGNLYPNALLAPQWNLNAHSIVYVTRGNGRMQIVAENGENVFDGQIREGQLIVVPQGFAVVKRAGNRGLEWISFKTNDVAMTSQLAGRASVLRGLPLDVIQNSFQVSRDEAQRLKYNRQELTVFTPGPRSQWGLTVA
ncbi:glutelin type-A 1 [Citrus sinensis]|nr:glutelin type-A 1 [Citrus sinensis]